MVLKPRARGWDGLLLFESSVIFNGTQTALIAVKFTFVFESSVIFNGTQTKQLQIMPLMLFESSVSCLLFYYLPYS